MNPTIVMRVVRRFCSWSLQFSLKGRSGTTSCMNRIKIATLSRWSTCCRSHLTQKFWTSVSFTHCILKWKRSRRVENSKTFLPNMTKIFKDYALATLKRVSQSVVTITNSILGAKGGIDSTPCLRTGQQLAKTGGSWSGEWRQRAHFWQTLLEFQCLQMGTSALR